MPPLPMTVSKGQIDRAAKTWRKWCVSEPTVNLEEAGEALAVIDYFRACHQYPLQKATVGLRSSVFTERAPVQVSQRLKRYMTILDKLQREPGMSLSRMQDIGGCRAVLPDIATLRAVQRRLERRRGYVRTADYLTNPRSSGYRGVHVIVVYDERTIEVQLRTQRIHNWAITVERLSGRLNIDLKSGRGPEELQALFRVGSDADNLLDLGRQVSSDLSDAVHDARETAVAFLEQLQEGNK